MRRLAMLAIDLSQKNVRNRFQHALRSAFQQVGQPNKQLAFTHANGVVHIGEGVELDVHFGYGRTRPQLTVAMMKDFLNVRRQDLSTLSREELRRPRGQSLRCE